MQGFIDKKYYVECHSKHEIKEFMQICQDANLTLRSGLSPNTLSYETLTGAVFAYNYRGEHDGISMWGRRQGEEVLTSDGNRPHKLFQNLICDEIPKDIPDILTLL